MAHMLEELARITDVELVCRLEGLCKADRALTAKLLLHLGEVEVRNLHRERGYSSMFDYCSNGLGMAEGEAYARIQAARLGRRFPLVVERVGAGALHLSGLRLLAPLLTAENHVELLDRACGKSKRQIERMVADLAPKPDVQARLTKLPERRSEVQSQTTSLPAQSSALLFTPQPSATSASAQPTASPVVQRTAPSTFALQSPSARASCTPLGGGRFKLVVPLGQEAHDHLEQLVELLRHQYPSGDLTRIVERAVRELLEREMKRRFAQTKSVKPRVTCKPAAATLETSATLSAAAERGGAAKGASTEAPAKSRYIPRNVVREVYARDMGQCTYVSPDGRRCTARGFLEVHHHSTTFGRGGAATVENLRLACRAHNLFLAERDYGRELVQAKLREAFARKQGSRGLAPGRELF